jgi:hypothetical protein
VRRRDVVPRGADLEKEHEVEKRFEFLVSSFKLGLVANAARFTGNLKLET